jgi:hypothetical protein
MAKALERRIRLLETNTRWKAGPTIESARAEVIRHWNPLAFGPINEPTVILFARQFMRDYERNRADGYDASVALRGATAGVQVWMRFSPAELQGRCERLFERMGSRTKT